MGKKEEQNIIYSLDHFENMATKYSEFEDFLKAAKKMNNVHVSVAAEFQKKYGKDGAITPEEALKVMYDQIQKIHAIKEDVKVGKKMGSKEEQNTELGQALIAAANEALYKELPNCCKKCNSSIKKGI